MIWKSSEFILSDFLLKALSHQIVFKNALEKFNAPRLQVINEINRNHQVLQQKFLLLSFLTFLYFYGIINRSCFRVITLMIYNHLIIVMFAISVVALYLMFYKKKKKKLFQKNIEQQRVICRILQNSGQQFVAQMFLELTHSL